MIERLHGTIQPYAWGSTTAIPELLGQDPTGEPQAELWLGAHPKSPATIGGRGLDAAITDDPEGTVGRRAVESFGPKLPYLLKVLSAAEPLSLQAHPTRAQAEAGYAKENAAGIALDAPDRLFRDDWPKPEMLVALGDVDALCGFREPAETHDLFTRLGAAAALDLVAPLEHGGSDQLREVFAAVLRLSDVEAVVGELTAAAREVGPEDGADLALFAQTAVELASAYPGSSGIVAGLLLNRIRFGQDGAVFLPAGNLHAYLHGTGVEIMANSDNVLRGGLTPKHIDVDALLDVLDFTPGFAGLVATIDERDGIWRYDTPAPEFALWRIEAGEAPIDLPGVGSGRIVLVTAGAAVLASPDTELTLAQGQSAFVGPSELATLSGPATVFVAGPGPA